MQLNEKDPVPGITIKFMNRLSDFLFVLARMIGKELEAQEIKWPL
jgi:cob(I)alamin adenosyltransferase